MSIKLLDTIYKLTDNADKVDGKHASDFATSGHTHSYLPLSGGTIAGTLNIKRDAAAICYQNSSGTTLGWLGITSSGVGTLWESNGSTKHTLLHSGNSSVSKSGETLTVTINGVTQSLTNTNTNTWRGITDSYSGTATDISLSQKGGKALYDALVNGYASSAGNADTLDNYHASSFGIWRGIIQTDPEADDTTYTTTADFLKQIHARTSIFSSNFSAFRGSWYYVGNVNYNTGVGSLEMAGTAVLNISGNCTNDVNYKSLMFLDRNGELFSYVSQESGVATWSKYAKSSEIKNATITIKQAGTSKGSFTLNQSSNVTIELTDSNTNTTYSAGTGLSLSGTTFNHASSVTAGTAGTSSATSGSTLAVPYVTVNATGHVTGYGTHTHTISGFAPSSHTHDYAVQCGTVPQTGRVSKSGFYETSSATTVTKNHAFSSTYMHFINCQHSNTANNYALQIAASFYDNVNFKIRVTNNSDSTTWNTILHNNNWSSYCAAKSHTHDYAASSHTHTTIVGNYTANGGQQNPNYFGKNRVGALMMNTSVNGNSHYKDWLFMDCYSGSDVGGGVAIGVNRQVLGAYIMRSAAARTSWAESAELLGTHNWSSYCAAKSHTHSSILDSGNSTTTTFAYSKAGLNYADYTWLAAWNGYELRAVNKSQFAQASHTHNYAASSHTHNYAASSHTHNYAGSSSAGGAATSANKLNTNAGSATKPVYFSGGVPVQVTGCMVQYWAIYEVFFGSGGTSSSFVKKAGNHNFYSSVITHEGVGNIIVNISYPSGFDETSTFIFGNGDHRESNHANPIYLVVNKMHLYLRLTLADDSTTNWGYAYLYFLCIS